MEVLSWSVDSLQSLSLIKTKPSKKQISLNPELPKRLLAEYPLKKQISKSNIHSDYTYFSDILTALVVA